MENIQRADYIGWLAKLLCDPRRGEGFIATEFVRRLPQPGCAVGVVGNATVSFTTSGSGVPMGVMQEWLDNIHERLSGEPSLVEDGNACLLTIPLPGCMPTGRRAIVLASKPATKEALSDNRLVVEQVVETIRLALVESGQAADADSKNTDVGPGGTAGKELDGNQED